MFTGGSILTKYLKKRPYLIGGCPDFTIDSLFTFIHSRVHDEYGRSFMYIGFFIFPLFYRSCFDVLVRRC